MDNAAVITITLVVLCGLFWAIERFAPYDEDEDGDDWS